MGLYKNKFKIESSRLKDWDYSTPWWYYITICTKDMKCCFGEIKNSRMILNKAGEIIDSEWKRTPVLRKMVELDYYVIMPDHFHGIIIINGEEDRDVVETHRDASLRMVKNNLSDIMRGFKGSCTKQIHLTGNSYFKWQPRFYDHIIRNENDLHRIRTYIQNNPLKWERELDEYYQKS
jgi:REP element-mobilizing transposase RayT